MTELTTIELDANGIHFTALAEGSGPLLLCLHGFPDDAQSWRHQLPYFAKAGYRVVAPYMRGYAPTAASPTGTYQSAALGRDVTAILDALSPDEPAFLFGHDWGAIAALQAAITRPARIRQLVAEAIPYGPRLATAFGTSYAQQKRSWYIFFFQTFLADGAVAADDFRFIRRLWHDWSPDWDFSEDDIGPTLETLARPGVLEAALGYYRCMFDPALQDPALAAEQMLFGVAPVAVPTLSIHGANDGCMGVELMQDMEASFPAGLEKMTVQGAGHFVHCEKPGDVNERVRRFFEK